MNREEDRPAERRVPAERLRNLARLAQVEPVERLVGEEDRLRSEETDWAEHFAVADGEGDVVERHHFAVPLGYVRDAHGGAVRRLICHQGGARTSESIRRNLLLPGTVADAQISHENTKQFCFVLSW